MVVKFPVVRSIETVWGVTDAEPEARSVAKLSMPDLTVHLVAGLPELTYWEKSSEVRFRAFPALADIVN